MSIRSVAGLLLLSTACRPEEAPPSAQPEDRPTVREPVPPDEPEAPATLGCEGPALPLVLRGTVSSKVGPVADLAMGVRQEDGQFRELTRTDAAGVYQMAVDGPAVYTVLELVSVPGERCTHDELPASWLEESSDAPRIVEGRDFKVPPVCPIEVQVLGPKGRPLVGAKVSASTETGSISATAPTGMDGRVTLNAVQCGVVGLTVEKRGFVTGEEEAAVPEGLRSDCSVFQRFRSTCLEVAPSETRPTVVLHMTEAVRLHGVITDASGQAVAGAEVHSLHGDARSGAEGRYELWVPGHGLEFTSVWVSADGYQEAHSGPIIRGWEKTDDGWRTLGDESWERDFKLDSVREVEVRCLGISPWECGRLVLACDPAEGETRGRFRCSGDDPQLCQCPPSGAVVVSGGGVAVRVEEGQDLAWLDLRPFTGGIEGRVEGAKKCIVSVQRSSTLGWPLSRGRPTYRSGRCDKAGRFEFNRLPPGEWTVEVRAPGELGVGLSVPEVLGWNSSGEEREVEVADDTVDIGLIVLED